MGTEESYSLGPMVKALIGLLLAVLIGAIGFVLSCHTGDEMWASRFGSLIVVFGLFFLVFLRWQNDGLKNGNKVWDQAVKNAINANSASAFEVAAKRMRDALNEYGFYIRSKWLFLSEVMILSFGTFLWGFGDLLASKLVVCGEWQC